MATALHLGPLHPVEQALTLLLAFGPFLVLGVVILVRRRQDAAAEEEEAADRSAEETAEVGVRERDVDAESHAQGVGELGGPGRELVVEAVPPALEPVDDQVVDDREGRDHQQPEQDTSDHTSATTFP